MKKLTNKIGWVKGRFLPDPYAQTYMYGSEWQKNATVGLRVRVVADKRSSDGIWTRFYVGGKRIWDCNYQFFLVNFIKVVSK